MNRQNIQYAKRSEENLKAYIHHLKNTNMNFVFNFP